MKTATRPNVIYDHLKALGIAHVEITYDGSSDSGCIEEVRVLDEDNNILKTPDDVSVTVNYETSTYDIKQHCYRPRMKTETLTLADAITNWAYDLLEQHFAGWENNDGAFGTIRFDVATRKGKIDHETRYTETHYSEVEV